MEKQEIEKDFLALGPNYKTKDVDNLAKRYIKERKDVSALRNCILDEQQYHRLYFQVSLANCPTAKEKFDFIEANFDKLADWWHVDQLTQFIGEVDFAFAFSKAKKYVESDKPFARRWGYVLFMPKLVKDEKAFHNIVSLLHDDTEYYVVMGEAWLISYLAIYHPQKTLEYMTKSRLSYDILGKAIQKICDSFRVSDAIKDQFRSLRAKLRNN